MLILNDLMLNNSIIHMFDEVIFPLQWHASGLVCENHAGLRFGGIHSEVLSHAGFSWWNQRKICDGILLCCITCSNYQNISWGPFLLPTPRSIAPLHCLSLLSPVSLFRVEHSTCECSHVGTSGSSQARHNQGSACLPNVNSVDKF